MGEVIHSIHGSRDVRVRLLIAYMGVEMYGEATHSIHGSRDVWVRLLIAYMGVEMYR